MSEIIIGILLAIFSIGYGFNKLIKAIKEATDD